MLDGHLNKCKDCTKKDVSERETLLRETDPSYVAKQRLRGRQKHKRLYSGKKVSSSLRKKSMNNYKDRYPETIKAKSLSGKIKAPDGYEKHHWSYRDGDEKDVIFLSTKDHNRVHRYLVYDKIECVYRTLEGCLLDTREKHEDYVSAVLNIPEFV